MLDCVERLPATLWRIEGLPLRVLDRYIYERKQGRQRWLKRLIECQQLPRDLLPDLTLIVPGFNLEVGLQ